MGDIAGENEFEYRVAVRSLCEFTARAGDLALRFTPSPSAQQGMAGHATVAGRRGARYQREVWLEGRYRSLEVRGRADGYDPDANRLEEIKTHRGNIARMPANQRDLHWAQLETYGALLCAKRALDEIELVLVYFDIKSEAESALPVRCAAADLARRFEARCEAFLRWARCEVLHRRRRNRHLAGLELPHRRLHAGQRQMAEAVYKAALRAASVLVQAPTGSGKTIASLFPLLKAMPAARLDKILYLTAKTSGRALAIDVLRALIPAGPPVLRVLEMVAKGAACRYPGRACDGASCPLARGFYDRLPRARLAALEVAVLDESAVQAVAAEAQVCPYFLSQEMARWCDVVVADYHYFFDSGALLHALASQDDWRVGLLVDEAHNLVPRARDMYSATLEPDALAAAFPEVSVAVRTQLRHVERAWQDVCALRPEGYFALASPPAGLVARLQRLITAIADELADDAAPGRPFPGRAAADEAFPGRAAADDPIMRLHFDALHFCRMADAFGPHSLFDVSRTPGGAALCIRNVCPAPFLAPRFASCTTAALFSATLSPADYHRRLLGLSADAAWIDVASPFDAGQLEVRVARRISTRYRDRSRTLTPLADLMARQYRERPGNYLAFFNSYQYLGSALGEFTGRHPGIPVWEQVRGMDGRARRAFLERFTDGGHGIGFAVLGGVFAEGIDLPGDRLIGAFIATLGLPRADGVNAEIERRMQELFDAGYEYTYLYPGLQKVVQAAGRVIRGVSDRGTLHLIDDRYLDAGVRGLLPRWWRIQCS